MCKLKILITGISGFIGRSLVEEIVNQGLSWDIYGIDIKEPIFNDSKHREHINFTMVDIRDVYAVKIYFDKNHFDGVIHLAAISRVVDAENDKKNCVATNLNGTKYVVENVAKQSNSWFILGSSREVYGEQKELPVKESAKKSPINIYGECKLLGEILTKEFIKRYAILRFSNVYGNNYDIDGRVIPTFVKRAIQNEILYLEGGSQIIDFTYIGNTIECIIKTIELLQNNSIQNEEIHISPGVENKITDIIVCLEKLLNKKINVEIREKRNYDVVRFIGDSSHRLDILKTSEFKNLSEGISLYLQSLSV